MFTMQPQNLMERMRRLLTYSQNPAIYLSQKQRTAKGIVDNGYAYGFRFTGVTGPEGEYERTKQFYWIYMTL